MAVKIRLARLGRKKKPFYRIVAVDSRMPRSGRFIEILGFYDPVAGPDNGKVPYVRADVNLINKWLGYGAQMTDRIKWLVAKGYIVLGDQDSTTSSAAAEQ